MQAFLDAIVDLWTESGLARLFNFSGGGWKNLIMIAIACVLLFLAIKKQFEPLLLLPIAFGMLLVNLPLSGIMDPQQNSLVAFTQEEFFRYADGNYEQVYPVFEQTVELNEQHASLIQTTTTASGKEIRYIKNGDSYFLVTGDLSDGTAKAVLPMWQHFDQGGLLWYLYQGVKFGIYPPLIFLGIGAMTDFGPLLSNPKSCLLGAAEQSAKIRKAERIENYPAFLSGTGEELAALLKRQLEESGIEMKTGRAAGVYAGGRLLAESEAVALAAFRALRRSSFRVRGGEEEVRLPELGLRGKADRVDAAGNYVRVIDYKTGNFDPSPTAYYTGRSLQLELYLLAAARGGKPAGAFYFPAEDKFTGPDDAKFRMQGFFDCGDEVVSLLDNADGAGSLLFDGASSRGMEEGEFADFLNYSRLVALRAREELRAGNVTPSPYEGSCEWCAFKGACGFAGAARSVRGVRCADIAAIARGEDKA